MIGALLAACAVHPRGIPLPAARPLPAERPAVRRGRRRSTRSSRRAPGPPGGRCGSGSLVDRGLPARAAVGEAASSTRRRRRCSRDCSRTPSTPPRRFRPGRNLHRRKRSRPGRRNASTETSFARRRQGGRHRSRSGPPSPPRAMPRPQPGLGDARPYAEASCRPSAAGGAETPLVWRTRRIAAASSDSSISKLVRQRAGRRTVLRHQPARPVVAAHHDRAHLLVHAPRRRPR